MARPINDQVLQNVTATGASEPRFSKGHRSHSLFVVANEAVSGTIEVALEVSPDGKNWSTMTTLDGTVEITDTDFDSTGVAMLGSGGCATELLRANVKTNSDNVELSIWIMSSSHGGPARRGGGAGEV